MQAQASSPLKLPRWEARYPTRGLLNHEVPRSKFTGDSISFSHHTKNIFSQNVPDSRFLVSPSEKLLRNLGKIRGVPHALWHEGPVKIRAQTDVIRADQTNGMVDVFNY